ncbi:MAG: helix-turn-helix transcriptional regulator, partial [Bacteroidales bacterium]|nr:helix-turn-helix transcriptional regulator [Bacteroidales bacterium]
MVDLKLIKKLCYDAGITMKTLSEKTKISQTALAMAIQRNSTTLETLEKVAHFFGVSVGVFFGEKDSFNPIRKSFERLDNDAQKAYNYIMTTLLFYSPELKNPVPKDKLIDAMENVSPEVAKIIQFTIEKVAENPTFGYLMQFSYEEILQLQKDGIITQDTVDLILMNQNADFFEK